MFVMYENMSKQLKTQIKMWDNKTNMISEII